MRRAGSRWIGAESDPDMTDVKRHDASRLTVRMASDEDREAIYRIRHDVYAAELHQHPENPERRLTDALDAHNAYVVARLRDRVVGFISITSPGGPGYSIDKYVPRNELPFPVDEGLYELRLLTVIPGFRGLPVAGLLMYAAFRWAEARGACRIVVIGRCEVVEIYLKVGLKPVGRQVRSGAVTFELMTATVDAIRFQIEDYAQALRRQENRIDWQLPVPFRRPEACPHGGAFFAGMGNRFEGLEAKDAILNADVLDAWFPPAPGVLSALKEHLPWLLRSSPPTACEGLVQAIADARGVPPECVLMGGGSSNLIFLALREWLTPDSRVLLPDPTYGEYPHVLENIIGCRVDWLPLVRSERYDLDPDRLSASLEQGYDLIVLVNPNSPTGRHLPRESLERLLTSAPETTRFWIDETYVDFAGPDESLEQFAAASGSVVVCKSMSKAYALSGARVAYLCGPAPMLAPLRFLTPPWSVSLLGQLAAVRALQDPEYYSARYAQTRRLRESLCARLENLGLDVIPGTANFLLCHLPEDGLDSRSVVEGCRREGLFLRDAAAISPRLGVRALRVAVLDREANDRMLDILARVLAAGETVAPDAYSPKSDL